MNASRSRLSLCWRRVLQGEKESRDRWMAYMTNNIIIADGGNDGDVVCSLCCACGGGSTRVTPSPTVSNDPTISPAPTTFGNFEVATFGELSDAIESAPNSGRQWVITLIGRISIRSMLDLAPGTSIKLAGPLTQPQVCVFPSLANNADGFLFMVREVYSLW